jgi:hypothetical protein
MVFSFLFEKLSFLKKLVKFSQKIKILEINQETLKNR